MHYKEIGLEIKLKTGGRQKRNRIAPPDDLVQGLCLEARHGKKEEKLTSPPTGSIISRGILKQEAVGTGILSKH
ncbi:MAG: hypothetical protein ACO394_00110 [Blastocatellia bacterium]